MNDFTNFIRDNIKGIAIAYIVASFFVIGILIRRITSHECQRTIIEINEETKQKLKQIDDAETRHDIDSLLRELYGFESVD
jgi:hypothetical protein